MKEGFIAYLMIYFTLAAGFKGCSDHVGMLPWGLSYMQWLCICLNFDSLVFTGSTGWIGKIQEKSHSVEI